MKQVLLILPFVVLPAAGLAQATSPALAGDECSAHLQEAARIGALRDKDAAAGIAQARAALEAIPGSSCPEATAELHAALGDNLNVAARRDDAIAAYRAGIELLEPLGASSQLASLLRREGIAHAESGDLATALDRSLQSLRLAETVGAEDEAAMAAGNAATLYSRTQDFDRARQYFERAHAGFLASGNHVGAAGTGINLASLLMRQADRLVASGDTAGARLRRSDALAHSLDALKQFEALDHPRGLAMAASNAGVAEALLGRFDAAVDLHRRALAVQERIGDQRGRAFTNQYIASALISLRRFDEAEAHLRVASEMAPNEQPALQLAIAEKWMLLEEGRGRLGAALEHARNLSRLQSEQAEADHRTRVAEIQARYDSEQQAMQIQALQQEQEITQLTLARQRVLLAAGAAVLILLAWTTVLLVRDRKRTRTHSLELERSARTDPLTGLPNRRDIREKIEYEMRRSSRTGEPFSVAVIDLDDFKLVNDRHGHHAGDRVLRVIGEKIQASLRRQDTVARWGGDEFLVLLPDSGCAGAAAVAQKIVSRFVDEPIRCGEHTHRIGFTVGVAEYRPGLSVDNLVGLADEAMYRGKAGLKNQVVAAG